MPAGAFGPLPVPPALVDRVVELAIAIQSIPAPTFDEGRRAEYVCGQFLAAGLADVQIDSAGNVYGRRAGGPGMTLAGAGCARIHASGASPEPPGQARPPLVVSAHTDTVFPLGTDLTLQRVRGRARLVGPGIGDNALGVAGLLGLAWLLDAAGAETPGDLWLVANSREEGLGDLCGMKAVVERFGGDLRAGEARIDAGVSRSAVAGPSGLRAGVTLAPAASAGVPASVARAYIVLEGMALGHIYHRGIRVRRCRITARTPGGHSWLHFGRPSAVHALLRLGAQLADLSVPASPKTTFNVRTIC